MVQAMINISTQANQILNIVKAKNNLKDKSQAIELVIKEYGEDFLEPQLRPEYVEKLMKIKDKKGIRFGSVEELERHIENA